MELTVLFDVDNTLLDNDRAKRALDARLAELLGAAGAARFWGDYEAIRAETGMVNIPLTMARYDEAMEEGAEPADPGARRRQRFALADLVMGFPYGEFLYPGALDAIAYARTFARVAILSEGDPTFQPSKIWRAGLDHAVAGNVLVFDHKIDHLAEVVAAFPADHYVLVEDKPDILRETRSQLGERLTTVFVRQGKYADAVLAPPPPDIELATIGDLLTLGPGDLTAKHIPLTPAKAACILRGP
ncbi:MAG: HAD family hydrolase [Chloroflexia bacterium]|nr:HAD family hydrolase [Chloroflexia bacterium]